ncbi:MAG: hypothetical protein AB7H97_15445 [Pseudobdellovibrionaceae bacterium]
MSLDDLKDQFQQIWARIQDSSIYINLKEKYDNLTPSVQKVVAATVVVLGLLIILSFPYGTLSESSTFLTEFEDRRNLIRELRKASREFGQIPQINGAMEIGNIQSMIQGELTRIQLLPEQVVSQQSAEASGSLIPKNLLAGAFQVQLSKLNFKQIVDIGTYLQNLAPNIKLEDLEMDFNKMDPKYFDVVYKLTSFTVPKVEEPEPEPPSKSKGRKRGSDQ